MRLRSTIVLLTVSLLAVGAPQAMASGNGRGKSPATRSGKGGRGKPAAKPEATPRRRTGQSTSALGGTRAGEPASRTRTSTSTSTSTGTSSRTSASAAPVRTRAPRIATQPTYATPLHEARARHMQQRLPVASASASVGRRPGRIKGWLIGAGVAIALSVGFVAGNAFGLGNAFHNIVDRGQTQQEQVWDHVPAPPSWAPGFGERPDWAPQPPDPGSFPQLGNGHTSNGGGPPSAEQIQQQLDKLMGNNGGGGQGGNQQPGYGK